MSLTCLMYILYSQVITCPPLTFGFRALESYRAAVVKVGHLTIPFPIQIGSGAGDDPHPVVRQ